NAVVNVSGLSGGGSVRLGGDFHGANPDVLNATRTYIGPNATIDADAVGCGSGGRVVVWSEELTAFYGQILARGGSFGGDGGFTEISSRRSLTERGQVDLSAPSGHRGTLLLDPLTITIVHGTSAADDSELNNHNPGPQSAGEIFFTDSPASGFTIS